LVHFATLTLGHFKAEGLGERLRPRKQRRSG
jgi:hypothetical protein